MPPRFDPPPLDSAAEATTDVLIRGARLFDPRAGLDGIQDILLRDGDVAEIGDSLDAPDGAEVVDAGGLTAVPAFVDPHVHLRTPGREDEEAGGDVAALAVAAGATAADINNARRVCGFALEAISNAATGRCKLMR
jgi:dihydroorotase